MILYLNCTFVPQQLYVLIPKSYANLQYEISSYQEKNLLWSCLSPKLRLFKKVLLDKIFFTVNN